MKRERGHMLLVAIILTTLLSLLLAMTIVPTNTASVRMKEQELVYRGTHLAQGIRRYYAKFGRFPFDLEELVDEEPRFVRQLYKDPMTEEGEWTLVYLTLKDADAVKGLNRALSRSLGAQLGLDPEGGEENSENVQNKPNNLFRSNRRQITGIRSQSDKEGLTVRDDSSIYSDWLFTALPQKTIGLSDISDAINRVPGGR